MYTYLRLSLQTICLSSNSLNHTHRQLTSHPPAYSSHTTNNIKHVNHLKSLRLSPSPTTSLCTYLRPPSQTACLFSHCFKYTHKQLTSHPHAHNANTTNNIEHLTHLKSLRLSSLQTKNLYTHLRLSIQTLRYSSHCFTHTHERFTNHPPAHSAHTSNNIRHVAPLKSLRLSPSLATDLYTELRLPPQTLCLSSHCFKQTHLPLTCTQRTDYKQRQTRQSLHTSRATPSATTEGTNLLTASLSSPISPLTLRQEHPQTAHQSPTCSPCSHPRQCLAR